MGERLGGIQAQCQDGNCGTEAGQVWRPTLVIDLARADYIEASSKDYISLGTRTTSFPHAHAKRSGAIGTTISTTRRS